MNEFSLFPGALTSLTGAGELVPGAVGGAFNVFVGHPMDLIKVQQQSSVSSTATASSGGVGTMLRSIFLKEGVNGLYRGVSSPLLAVTPAFAISFYSFDMAKATLRKYSRAYAQNGQLSLNEIALAGAFSGIPLATVVGPSERIKCLMQVNKNQYSGFSDCFRQVYKEGGIRSVFRGTGSAILRDVPGNATYFATYELGKRAVMKIEGTPTPSMTGTFMAGGVAGVGNWIVAIPFDVIKSRWQTALPGQYSSLFDVLKQLVEKEGFPALFKGLSPALLRAFPANGACILGFETAKNFMSSTR